jgi:hypothetical protein
MLRSFNILGGILTFVWWALVALGVRARASIVLALLLVI